MYNSPPMAVSIDKTRRMMNAVFQPPDGTSLAKVNMFFLTPVLDSSTHVNTLNVSINTMSLSYIPGMLFRSILPSRSSSGDRLREQETHGELETSQLWTPTRPWSSLLYLRL